MLERRPLHYDYDADIKKNEFKKAPIMSRLLAAILDLLLLIVGTCCTYAFIIQPILNLNDDYISKYNAFKEVLVESGLYEYTNEDYQKIVDNPDYECEYIDQKLSEFYAKYDKIENYDKLKQEQIDNSNSSDALFFKDSSGEIQMVAENKDSDAMKAWLRTTLNASISNVLEKTDDWINAAEMAGQLVVGSCTLALIIMCTIIYFIIPLITKGTTIGKYVMNLRVYSFKTNSYTCTQMQILFRFFTFVVLEILFGIYTMGFVPLISMIISYYNKKSQSLHDFLSNTAVSIHVVDKTNPVDSFSKKAIGAQRNDF